MLSKSPKLSSPSDLIHHLTVIFKMSSLLHTIILVSLAVASPSFNRQQPLALQTSQPTWLKLPASASHEDWRAIPGDSPFRYCSDAHPETDLFDIERVTLHPNPIQRCVHLFPS